MAAKEYQTQYGNISAASIGTIQRGLVALGQQGGDLFFGEPAMNIEGLLQVDAMSELFEKLPVPRIAMAPHMHQQTIGCDRAAGVRQQHLKQT